MEAALLSSSSSEEEVTLTITRPIETSLERIRRLNTDVTHGDEEEQLVVDRRRPSRIVLLSFEGTRNNNSNSNNHHRSLIHAPQQQQQHRNNVLDGGLFSQDEIYSLFETIQQYLGRHIEQLRIEWNMFSASNLQEQPPILTLNVLRLLLTSFPKLHTLTIYRMQFMMIMAGQSSSLSLPPQQQQQQQQQHQYQEFTRRVVSNNKTIHTIRIEFCKSISTSAAVTTTRRTTTTTRSHSTNHHNNFLDDIVLSLSKLGNLKEMEIIGNPEFPDSVCSSRSLECLGDEYCPNLQCIKLWGGIWQPTNSTTTTTTTTTTTSTAEEESEDDVDDHDHHATNDDDGLISLVTRGLQTTKSLKDIEIGLFTLNLSSSKAIASLIRNNNTIQRIWMDTTNPILEEALQPLLDALKVNNTIHNFNIVSTTTTSTPTPTSTATTTTTRRRIKELVVEMLEEQYSIRHCTIGEQQSQRRDDDDDDDDDNNSNDEQQQEQQQQLCCRYLQDKMDLFLRLNRVGRDCLLGPQRDDRNRWLLALTCERNNTSTVFYLLSKNPTFISQCVVDVTNNINKKRKRTAEAEVSFNNSNNNNSNLCQRRQHLIVEEEEEEKVGPAASLQTTTRAAAASSSLLQSTIITPTPPKRRRVFLLPNNTTTTTRRIVTPPQQQPLQHSSLD